METHYHFPPRRPLGRTGFRASMLGIGDLADPALPRATCVATLRRALVAGLNVIDTAPGYADGLSEELVGEAVRDHREGVFLIDKIDHLHEPVAPQVEASLARMGLAYMDLAAFHAVPDLQTWRRLTAPGGGMEQLEACVKAGQVRFRGLSSHQPEVLLAALEAQCCDVLMFPVGPFVDPRYEQEVLPRARQQGVGTVCFKTFGAGKLVGDTSGYGQRLSSETLGHLSAAAAHGDGPLLPRISVGACVHYTLTVDPDVALLGLSTPEEQDAAFAAARAFHPLTPAQLAVVRQKATMAMRGKGGAHWNPA